MHHLYTSCNYTVYLFVTDSLSFLFCWSSSWSSDLGGDFFILCQNEHELWFYIICLRHHPELEKGENNCTEDRNYNLNETQRGKLPIYQVKLTKGTNISCADPFLLDPIGLHLH